MLNQVTRLPKQTTLAFRTWGGARKGAGRKPKGDKALVSHAPRPDVAAAHPLHVTLRVARSVPNLRAQRPMRVLREAFRAAKERFDLRLVHYSVQGNHVHLLVETNGKKALSRAMQGLSIRMARALNKEFRRSGSVLADRYHARALKTPREVRNALAYVLLNHRHHAATHGGSVASLLGADPFSSARFFDGWARPINGARAGPEDEVSSPGTWLLRKGFRRLGLLDPLALPGLPKR